MSQLFELPSSIYQPSVSASEYFSGLCDKKSTRPHVFLGGRNDLFKIYSTGPPDQAKADAMLYMPTPVNIMSWITYDNPKCDCLEPRWGFKLIFGLGSSPHVCDIVIVK